MPPTLSTPPPPQFSLPHAAKNSAPFSGKDSQAEHRYDDDGSTTGGASLSQSSLGSGSRGGTASSSQHRHRPALETGLPSPARRGAPSGGGTITGTSASALPAPKRGASLVRGAMRLTNN